MKNQRIIETFKRLKLAEIVWTFFYILTQISIGTGYLWQFQESKTIFKYL